MKKEGKPQSIEHFSPVKEIRKEAIKQLIAKKILL